MTEIRAEIEAELKREVEELTPETEDAMELMRAGSVERVIRVGQHTHALVDQYAQKEVKQNLA